jgi:hypothetical protein
MISDAFILEFMKQSLIGTVSVLLVIIYVHNKFTTTNENDKNIAALETKLELGIDVTHKLFKKDLKAIVDSLEGIKTEIQRIKK